MKRILTILTVFWMLGSIGFAASASKTFDVQKGGMLDVSLGVGDILLTPSETSQVSIDAQGIDQEEMSHLKMYQEGTLVRVVYRPDDSHGRERFTISLPSEFDIDLRTAGGNIEIRGKMKGKLDGSTSGGNIDLGDVDGQVNMKTSGGNISAGIVSGAASLKTSGGNIDVKNSGGQVELLTSGGDITVGNVGKSLIAKTSGGSIEIGDVGGEVTAHTAGGDILVGKVSGNASLKTAGGDVELNGGNGIVTAKTAGGDVTLRNVSGSIEGSTAGGDVSADLNPSGSGRSRLTSAGGSIELILPRNAKATIRALINIQGRWTSHDEDYTIHSDFKAEKYEKDPDLKEIRAIYVLNGGGEDISLETTNGDISIRSR